MALRIEKAFGVSIDTLLRVQAWYDSHAMRQRAAEIDVSAISRRKSGHDPGSHPWRPAVAAVMIRHEYATE